jgi:iron complex outermembrane receptor protein
LCRYFSFENNGIKANIMKKTILFLIFSFTLFIADAQTGNVKGSVKTSDNLPAEFLNIGLKGTSKNAFANSKGEYEIKEVEPGTYTLIVSFTGLETKEQQIEINAGETTMVPEITLKESSQQLKEVTVTAFKSNNEQIVLIGKAPIKPLDLPQSISSIDKEVLDQQQTARLSDAIKNFNGVYVMGTSGGYQEELAGRGFAFSSSNTFKNGVRFNNTAMPEMSALERIEVMKGSAAILFGNVAAGGVLNLITKKPLFEKGGEVSMRYGSYDFYKPSIDVYGSLNARKTAAYRINTVYEKSRSFRDVVNAERFYINPSFLFKLGKKTDLLIEGDYLKDKRTADFGLGAINYTLIDIPRSRFLGVSWSYYNTEQKSATATITHHFNNKWQLRSVTAYQNLKSDLFTNQRPNGNSQFIKENGNWIRGLQRTEMKEAYAITQLDLTGQFSIGFLKHILLAGVDADNYLTENTSYNTLQKYDSINVFDPGKYEVRADIPNLTPKTLTKSPIKRAGVYLQDLISITEKIKLLAGIRFSYLETFSNVYTYKDATTVETKQFDHAFSPRLGLVYKPIKSMALFASYANSFTPNTGINTDGTALPPSLIDQYEIGVKNDLFRGMLSANLTVYQIKNSNLAQVSLANGNTNTNIKEMAGEITSKGIEIDLMSKAYKGISLIAGYSFNESRYTKSNTYIVGSKLLYNPSNTANASVYYNLSELNIKWLDNFNAGIGALYIGDRSAGRQTRVTVPDDTYKPIPLPAYTNLEGSLGYAKNNISVRIKMTNMLNALSYNVHDDNSVNPIAPRQFAATVAFKF